MFEIEGEFKKTSHVVSLGFVPMNSAFTGTLAKPAGKNHLYIKVPSEHEDFAVYRYDKVLKHFIQCTIMFKSSDEYTTVSSYHPVNLKLSIME